MKRRLCLISFCAVFLVALAPVFAQDREAGQVSGMLLTKDGVPMRGGLVYFFSSEGPLPDPDRYWRIPDFLAEITATGEFTTELPEGGYYLGAVKRSSGKTVNGPPLAGDYFYKALDDKGAPKLYVVKKGEKLDLGIIFKVPLFKGLIDTERISAIEGRVLDDGKPVAGMLVFAFLAQDMRGRPAFASFMTGTDGKYLLRVHEGGDYYLRARDHYGGGPPEAGALIGAFGGDPPQPVMVNTGEITRGIDIPVIRFQGRGQPR